MSVIAYKIIIICANTLKVSPRELITWKKGKNPHRLADVRFICYRLIKNETGLPLSDISRIFNKKTHCSIIHGLNEFEKQTFRNTDFRDKVERCVSAFNDYKNRIIC